MADSKLFRKVALDRLSSPEQIDRLLQITPAREWLGLVAVLALLGAGVAWGFVGSVTSKTVGQGVVIRAGGVQDVVSLGAGQVLEVRAATGETVREGDVVAIVAQPYMVDRIHQAEAQIRDLEVQQRQTASFHESGSHLQVGSIEQQRASLERGIGDLENQAKIAREEIATDQELLTKELITRQQVNATQQRLAGIETTIQERRAQIAQLETDRFRAEREGRDELVQVGNRIADARRDLEVLRRQMELDSRVRSPYTGQVVEVKLSAGSLVQAGTAIVALQRAVNRLEALVYVPSSEAKGVQPGMRVEVSPANVRREEFGFIRANVTFVSEYPATEAALLRVFENASLVKALAGGGPVTEVHVEMERDATTPSGFKWSSSKGAPIQLSGGTLISGEIVTEEKAPVNLVIPYLRERVGIR